MNPLALFAVGAAVVGIGVAIAKGGGGMTEITSPRQLLELDQRQPGPGFVVMYTQASKALRDALAECAKSLPKREDGPTAAAVDVEKLMEWYQKGQLMALPIDEEPEDILAHAPIVVASNESEMGIWAPADVIAKAKQALAEQGFGDKPENLGFYLFEWTGDPVTDARIVCEFVATEAVSEGPGAGGGPLMGRGMALYLVIKAQGEVFADEQMVPPEPQAPTPPGPPTPGLSQGTKTNGQAGFEAIPAMPKFEVKGSKVTIFEAEKVMPKVQTVPAAVVVSFTEELWEGGPGVGPFSLGAIDPTPEKTHSDWGLYELAAATVDNTNEHGLPSGYYFGIRRQHDAKPLVFGPFPDLKDIPGGRPEVDLEDAMQYILAHSYSHAKSLATG